MRAGTGLGLQRTRILNSESENNIVATATRAETKNPPEQNVKHELRRNVDVLK